jgi:AraC-like DNA-binding protein
MGDFIIFQNLIIGLILISNSKFKANLFLGIVFFLNGFQGFSHQLIVNRDNNEIAALLFLNSAPISCLLGPALYFYVRKTINPAFRFRRKDLVHLIPALLLFLLLIPYISSSYAFKINTIESIRKDPTLIYQVKFALGTSALYFFFRPLHILSCVFMCLRLVLKNKSLLEKDKTPFQAYILLRWLKMLLFSLALIYLLNLANMVYGLIFDNVAILNPISFVAALSIFFLNIQIFINPYILYGFTNVKYYSNDSFIAKLYKQVNAKPNLSADEDLKNELILKIEADGVQLNFTEKGYTLARMAEDVHIPQYHLNYYFKHIAQESFTDFKNRKRIQFAINLINDGYLMNYTVEHLSHQCGFSSRANFNNAFLKATGMSLKEYKKSV